MIQVSIGEERSVTTFKILATIPFTSALKMMTVFVQRESDEAVFLYTKGADSSVLPKVAQTEAWVEVES